MGFFLKAVFFLACASACSAFSNNGQKYEGYQVWRVVPSNVNQIKRLIQLQREHDKADMIDFWREASAASLNEPVDLMVPPGMQASVKAWLAGLDLEFTVTIPDVKALVSDQMSSIRARRATGRTKRNTVPGTKPDGYDYNVYHTYDEIQQWVSDIVADYPDITSDFILTHSYEGRAINGFRIRGRNSPGGETPPPAVWFEGGIHAREWISPATVMWFTGKLLEDYENGDQLAVDMFDNMDWYVVPSLNADGYDYTWTTDRLWRKTRSDNSEETGSGCMGADPNRNFPFGWGGNGTSPFPCSNIFHGVSPLSEVEVEGVVDYLRALKNGGQDFHVFIDWHSYGQYFLSPWSYSAYAPNPPDYDAMMLMAKNASTAIQEVHGKIFLSGSSIELLNEAAGSSKDWGYVPFDPTSKLKGGLSAKYSYTVELRDKGQYGFLLPEEQIVESGQEIYAGVRSIGDFILKDLGLIT